MTECVKMAGGVEVCHTNSLSTRNSFSFLFRANANEIMGAFGERITTEAGQMLKIRLEGNSVHLFDAGTGKRVAAWGRGKYLIRFLSQTILMPATRQCPRLIQTHPRSCACCGVVGLFVLPLDPRENERFVLLGWPARLAVGNVFAPRLHHSGRTVLLEDRSSTSAD